MMEVKQQPLTESLKKQIYEGFGRHAIAMTGFNEKSEPVAFVAWEQEHFVGAVVVEKFWGALHVKYVYVEQMYRGKGAGTLLMNHALAFGKQNDCAFAFVETMSFQGLGFYKKLGFELEFSRSGYAHDTSFHYLRKDIGIRG